MGTATPFRLRAPRVAELPLHQQIAAVLSLELAPPGRVSKYGVVWFSIDIAAYSGSAPGLRTSRGVVAGIPDIAAIYQGRAHHLEVKAPDGELSLPQQSVATSLLIAGARYAVVRDAREALAALDEWGIPRARRVNGL